MLLKPWILVIFCFITNHSKNWCLKNSIYYIIVSVGQTSRSSLAGWFWLKASWGLQSRWNCSHKKPWMRLKNLLPRWVILMAISRRRWFLLPLAETASPHHMGHSAGLRSDLRVQQPASLREREPRAWGGSRSVLCRSLVHHIVTAVTLSSLETSY